MLPTTRMCCTSQRTSEHWNCPLWCSCGTNEEDLSECTGCAVGQLECTNFSKAKGGQPRDADSRTLAEHLFRYIESINPDYIQIENVEEFMGWGDMDEHGHPISKDKGRCYEKWKRNVKRYGYDFDWRILNAADYGAYTTRKRFFGIFAKRGLPIVFPEPTHCKDGNNDMFGRLEKWKPVKDVLDFSDEGEVSSAGRNLWPRKLLNASMLV